MSKSARLLRSGMRNLSSWSIWPDKLRVEASRVVSGILLLSALACLSWSAAHRRPLLEQVGMLGFDDVCELLIVDAK